jgi:hypothetical protein
MTTVYLMMEHRTLFQDAHRVSQHHLEGTTQPLHLNALLNGMMDYLDPSLSAILSCIRMAMLWPCCRWRQRGTTPRAIRIAMPWTMVTRRWGCVGILVFSS